MRLTVAMVSLVLPAVWAQPPAPVISPEVHPDRRVTFRLNAPHAQKVELRREGAAPVTMEKDERGIWSVTVGPLEPDLYSYSLVADGVAVPDPSNHLMKPNLLSPQSMVHVPGPSSLPWELGEVPHGVLHRHFYRSAIVGDNRDLFVYTPPGYERASRRTYPVLYLLHGYSDDAGAWTAVGRAHIILDNLIAQGRAKPMLVVMPLGYGAPEIARRGGPGLRDPSTWRRNIERFRDALLKEVIPLVENHYRVSRQRVQRAIAGLSMGGTQSLFIGLNALDTFAYIGAFSSGGLLPDYDATFPELDAKANEKLRLLWIACGAEDRLIEGNRKLLEWLKSKGVRYEWQETSGAHTWMVWRRYLAEFAPRLF